MSTATDHATETPGAPTLRAADLQAGHRNALYGGEIVLTVQEATHDPDNDAVLLRLASAVSAFPLRLSSAAVVDLYVEPEQPPEVEEEDHEVTVTVELTVTEEVTYCFAAEVEVPSRAAADREALHEYLGENEEVWLDDLNPLTDCVSVNERSLDQVRLVLAA
ncbi:hypothetical protein AB0D13_40645 [Streptomyces sp. NPDC048430]|uniref:hypothetical protein n=1 Tax=Streptomyces sp. NPDC048430 TaxID=3155388 RepID=UPI003413F8B2